MPDFKPVYLAALKDRQPEEYAHLERSGELDAQAEQMAERALDQWQTLLAQMRRRDPGPASAPMRAQHLAVLGSQAEELAIEDLLPSIEMSGN